MDIPLLRNAFTEPIPKTIEIISKLIINFVLRTIPKSFYETDIPIINPNGKKVTNLCDKDGNLMNLTGKKLYGNNILQKIYYLTFGRKIVEKNDIIDLKNRKSPYLCSPPNHLEGKQLKNYKIQKISYYLDSFYHMLKVGRKLLFFLTLSFVFFIFAILSFIFMRNATFMKILDKMKLSFINRITQEVVVRYGTFALTIIFATSNFAYFTWFLGKYAVENMGVLGLFEPFSPLDIEELSLINLKNKEIEFFDGEDTIVLTGEEEADLHIDNFNSPKLITEDDIKNSIDQQKLILFINENNKDLYLLNIKSRDYKIRKNEKKKGYWILKCNNHCVYSNKIFNSQSHPAIKLQNTKYNLMLEKNSLQVSNGKFQRVIKYKKILK